MPDFRFKNLPLFLFLLLLAAFATPTAAQADPYAEGKSAFERGKYKSAYKRWKPLANAGDARAQTQLGILYEQGLGVRQDLAQAAHWYHQAAAEGYGRAQESLGFLYHKGRGVTQDPAQAAHWWHQASLQGYELAQLSLGLLYAKGQGVEKDLVQSFVWLTLSYDGAAEGLQEIIYPAWEEVASQLTPAQRTEAEAQLAAHRAKAN